MTKPMMSPDVRAQKMHSFVLKRLQGNQSAVAATMGVSEATLSRFKSEQLEMCCQVLAHAGIKTVGIDKRCFDEREIEALLYFARRRMEEMDNVKKLAWEDD